MRSPDGYMHIPAAMGQTLQGVRYRPRAECRANWPKVSMWSRAASMGVLYRPTQRGTRLGSARQVRLCNALTTTAACKGAPRPYEGSVADREWSIERIDPNVPMCGCEGAGVYRNPSLIRLADRIGGHSAGLGWAIASVHALVLRHT